MTVVKKVRCSRCGYVRGRMTAEDGVRTWVGKDQKPQMMSTDAEWFAAAKALHPELLVRRNATPIDVVDDELVLSWPNGAEQRHRFEQPIYPLGRCCTSAVFLTYGQLHDLLSDPRRVIPIEPGHTASV